MDSVQEEGGAHQIDEDILWYDTRDHQPSSSDDEDKEQKASNDDDQMSSCAQSINQKQREDQHQPRHHHQQQDGELDSIIHEELDSIIHEETVSLSQAPLNYTSHTTDDQEKKNEQQLQKKEHDVKEDQIQSEQQTEKLPILQPPWGRAPNPHELNLINQLEAALKEDEIEMPQVFWKANFNESKYGLLWRFLVANDLHIGRAKALLIGDIAWRQEVDIVKLQSMSLEEVVGCSRDIFDQHYSSAVLGYDEEDNFSPVTYQW